MGIALGIINTNIIKPFVYTFNNTEKLYTIVISNVLISLISLFQEGNAGNYLRQSGDLLLSFAILSIPLSAILFVKKRREIDAPVTSCIDAPIFHKRIYLTLFFNCVFIILCKGIGKGILNITVSTSEYSILMWYYIGGLAGCIVYLVIYAFSKRSFIWLGNITFGCFAMGLFCNAFSLQLPVLNIAFAILLGIANTIGMINMYYIISVVAKKYDSLNYLKLSILCIGICGGISGIVLGQFVQYRRSFGVPLIASILSVAIMLLLIMCSVVVSQTQYYDDWAKDSKKTEIDNEQLYMFKKYDLSKREIEVCKLLLQGYTMRQISGVLSIAYSTVNTYCTSLYRKLGINSRTELILLFKDYMAPH